MKDGVNYSALKPRVLEVMSKHGDAEARAELERRRASGEMPKDPGPLHVGARPRRRLVGWERPLVSRSGAYQWWPPQEGAPSVELHRLTVDYYRAQREEERRHMADAQARIRERDEADREKARRQRLG